MRDDDGVLRGRDIHGRSFAAPIGRIAGQAERVGHGRRRSPAHRLRRQPCTRELLVVFLRLELPGLRKVPSMAVEQVLDDADQLAAIEPGDEQVRREHVEAG